MNKSNPLQETMSKSAVVITRWTELRHLAVSDCIETISKEWIGLKQLVKIYRLVKDKGRIREEFAYFISSKQSNTLFYSQAIRLHSNQKYDYLECNSSAPRRGSFKFLATT